MSIKRHMRDDIREALQLGYKAQEIIQLYEEHGVTHTHVTRERRYLGLGKWGKKQRPRVTHHHESTLKKMEQVRELYLKGTLVRDIRAMLRVGAETVLFVKEDLMRQGYRFNTRGKLLNPNHVPTIPPTKWYDKPYTGINTAESGAAYRRPKTYKGISSDDNIEERHGAVTTVAKPIYHEIVDGAITEVDIVTRKWSGVPEREALESVISPIDYVKAFEDRVMEYHEELQKLRAENKRLCELNQKLHHEAQQAIAQARNFQPNSLIRTSLSNGG